MAMARASLLPLAVARLHVYQMLSLLLRSSGHVQNDASRGLQEGAGVRSICTFDLVLVVFSGCGYHIPALACRARGMPSCPRHVDYEQLAQRRKPNGPEPTKRRDRGGE